MSGYFSGSGHGVHFVSSGKPNERIDVSNDTRHASII